MSLLWGGDSNNSVVSKIQGLRQDKHRVETLNLPSKHKLDKQRRYVAVDPAKDGD